ncbi:extracellular solute-binding protein [Sneathiella limimaris]|uniref:extracellular solute-binding protein n=1 Tax=Sneathiella limimaris TaxID=1964213 RepID=UPI00146BFDBD|nr:extracellular solute-binding protein [Sneathiella limimaris]
MTRYFIIVSTYVWVFFTLAFPSANAEHALSMHGTPKYPPGFSHFEYTDPNAIPGGHLRLPAIGSFDSLQPFLVRGVSAKGLGLVYQSLMMRSKDEPFTLYPNIAKSVQTGKNREWVRFELDPKARFSNGAPVTAADVIFSYETLHQKGRPNHRHYYSLVERVAVVEPDQVTFHFKAGAGREMPLILGLMPILSKDYFQNQPFEETTLKAPLGTGPYLVEKLDPGKSITYKRVPDFWGQDMPTYRGRYNFERITYDYFRDVDIAFQAFLNQELDVFFESDPGKWVDRKIQPSAPYITREPKLYLPPPMLAIALNSRRNFLKSREVRKAILLAYDFEWVNENILHGQYERTTSFFGAGNLQATGLPDPAETKLLHPFKDDLPKAVFDEPILFPVSDGSGRIRTRLKQAKDLLQAAGYELSEGQLIDPQTGMSVTIEVIYNDTSHLKLLGNFKKNLKRLGITLLPRQLDDASYQNRITQYDFDMMFAKWGQSLSPGNEQQFYWSSEAAKTPGSRNYPGIQNKAVDHLVQKIATAETRENLETAVRALDRILLKGDYVIPLYHADHQWIYTAPEIRFPKLPSDYGSTLDLWWYSTAPVDD